MDNNKLNTAIEHCIAKAVRPFIQSHGGDIEFISHEKGIVTVRLLGACKGCPISLYTLKMGVLKELQASIPSITEVQEIEE